MDIGQDSTYKNPDEHARLDFSSFLQTTEQVKNAAAEIIVGQANLIELILVGMLTDGHVLLEGVPGVAKTLVAKTLASLLQTEFKRIQFTPDLMPADVLGTSIFNTKESVFEFHPGPIFSQIVLIDEINRAPAKTQAALFEVMEERQVSIDNKTYAMKEPFLVIATQNPVEQEGTYRLPEAQLDRFLFKIEVPYPNEEEEVLIMERSLTQSLHDQVESRDGLLSVEQLTTMKALVKRVYIAPQLLAYVAAIAKASRHHAGLYLGASPRASLAFLHASRALALLRGKDYVTPEELQFLAAPILRHRFLLSADREMEGSRPDDVVQEVLASIEVPR